MLHIRELALQSLKDRVKDATSLVICDPYILSSTNRQSEAEYVSELLGILPKNLNTLVLVSSGRENLGIKTFLEAEHPKHVKIHYFICKEIHDRVWIVNWTNAFATGTSLNSIGYSLSFINNLPKKDFVSFRDFLIKNLGDDFRKVMLEQRRQLGE